MTNTPKEIVGRQQEFFRTDTTKKIAFRRQQLELLLQVIQAHEARLCEAIYKDFGKSAHETFITELVLFYHEAKLAIRQLDRWSKPKRVYTGLVNFPARSYIVPEPLGTVLVIGAWNYPYQLTLLPAVAALAAGNSVVIKPSELPHHASAALASAINEKFDAAVLHVVEGGVEVTTELLKQRWDKIFFTGSTAVGKIVYEAAAKHLTPVTLELGGKSPAIVLGDCDIAMTAKRLVWAKLLNAGQTCVAPDYVLIERPIYDRLVAAIKKEMDRYPQAYDASQAHYMQIITQRHTERLAGLMQSDKVTYGGKVDPLQRFVSPTLMEHVSWDDAVMQEEIFGPVLPLLTFDDLETVIEKIKSTPKPLSLYVYGKDAERIHEIQHRLSYGGGCINDSNMHLSNSHLPFGGVGDSGMGGYHGEHGFKNFSHMKGILHKAFWLETPLKYAPYSHWKRKLIQWLVE
jgi:aldehyde dehydrogenase (NAD+)